MKNFTVKLFFLFVFLNFVQHVCFAQEIKKDENPAAEQINSSAENSASIKERINPPPIPVMKNTGNAEKDAADYTAEKEKWIDEILFLYRHKFSAEQKNKIREMLRKENLEDVMKGKILLTE